MPVGVHCAANFIEIKSTTLFLSIHPFLEYSRPVLRRLGLLPGEQVHTLERSVEVEAGLGLQVHALTRGKAKIGEFELHEGCKLIYSLVTCSEDDISLPLCLFCIHCWLKGQKTAF